METVIKELFEHKNCEYSKELWNMLLKLRCRIIDKLQKFTHIAAIGGTELIFDINQYMLQLNKLNEEIIQLTKTYDPYNNVEPQYCLNRLYETLTIETIPIVQDLCTRTAKLLITLHKHDHVISDKYLLDTTNDYNIGLGRWNNTKPDTDVLNEYWNNLDEFKEIELQFLNTLDVFKLNDTLNNIYNELTDNSVTSDEIVDRIVKVRDASSKLIEPIGERLKTILELNK